MRLVPLLYFILKRLTNQTNATLETHAGACHKTNMSAFASDDHL